MAVLELTAFGIIGSILLSFSFLPQCYHLLSTKSAGDISIYYVLILVAGSFCLAVYGYGIRDPIVFILNMYATLANSELMLLKVYYDRKNKFHVANTI
ncbi:MAG TPA: SemiSWEET family transporter [Methanocella sp.]|uniref:SemiSWEET family sugar transporter n=1 Tax=Methanocella sp. TaxID=2052833 RepID=UPI002B8FFE1E|nr:SemiSWEET family transporter [Methanocella sp.]HTY91330.1 SemiSWEET family transporter [Methanocella sp.]